MLGSGRVILRRFSTTLRKRGGINPDDELVPLHNVPFRYVNKYRFTLLYALFCSTGFSVPFLIVRHHTLKKR